MYRLAASRDVELSSWDLLDKSAGTNLQVRPQGEPVLCVKKEKEIFLTTYPKWYRLNRERGQTRIPSYTRV
jgi:hypothetical protein